MKKALSFMFYFAAAMAMFMTFAFAYIDPSAMTYLIQIIAGIVIACGAAFGFYRRKLKRSFRKKTEEAEDAAVGADVDFDIEYADEEDDLVDPNAAESETDGSQE